MLNIFNKESIVQEFKNKSNSFTSRFYSFVGIYLIYTIKVGTIFYTISIRYIVLKLSL